ncbi:protein kinase family protein [Mammaliicoccus vitulinus]|uniref:protein kinase family protein n=1 Tax=Mammaliicoccus vitulinus TaxID=71237 RepID=UPI00145BEC1C|nr:protein kinase family protein [Mammaliicoccus vitulinus]QJF26228.1 protein kinase family protein [Mammaliicoccus vitulinus]
MNIDIENTIANILDEIEYINVNPKYSEIYNDVENEDLKTILSILHHILSEEFKIMNKRLPTKDTEQHFWAENSRNLIECIEKINSLYYSLKNSALSIEIDGYYKNLLEDCELFLSKYRGSTIPKGMDKVNIYIKKKIFYVGKIVNIEDSSRTINVAMKNIGEGSYAKVFKYKDPVYNKNFVIKRAKNNLSEKELQRFKAEYESLRNLDSPYIIKVYKYNNEKNQFSMEYMNMNLFDYIDKNNAKLSVIDRKKIIVQFIKGFSYIHGKGMLHRDISPKNILIKSHDDGTIIVKVSDFGLVKLENSNLTSINTEFKGSFNDPNLLHKFNDYNMLHEIYALTYLVYFVMTGRKVIRETGNMEFDNFVSKGTNIDFEKRFQSTIELKEYFLKINFDNFSF